ncbi:MAG: TIGR03435 family protein, partial [Acidobacteriota bacterium]|nr:TIGR03435 family protein [Acidobacteriota bacterium]
MLGPMLQALLVERFRVAVHKEARETAVYALSVAKGGHKLRASTAESCVPPPSVIRAEPPKPGQYYCGFGQMRGGPTGTSAEWRGVTLEEFAGRMLSNQVDRPVVDQTGVAGHFDIRLDYTPQPRGGPILLNGMPAPPPPAAESASPSIFTALQEQLGLKLSPARAPLDVIVVDRAERPSEN